MNLSERSFKAGDVVTLRSGGPKMTVSSGVIRRDGRLQCEWFHDGKNLWERFNPRALLLIEANDEQNYKLKESA